jgi:hypothetical protein
MNKPLLALAAALIAVAGAARAEDARFEQARAEYEVGHYGLAFTTFAALADECQCDAARIALQMARLGRALYPVGFRVDTERLQRWQRRADCPPRVMAGR